MSTPNRHKSRQKKSPLASLLVLAMLIAVMVIGVVIYTTAFAPTDRPAQTLTVKQGDTYHGLLVADRWQRSALASDLVTKVYLKLHAGEQLQQGTYAIPAGASLKHVVDILAQGAKVSMIRVQIIEGRTIKDLYQLLKTTEGVNLTVLSPMTDSYTWQDVERDNQAVAEALGIQAPNGNLEGQFAPNTYFFDQGTSDQVILQKLYNDQQKTLLEAWEGRASDLPYNSPYEALIMASIIEKETGISAERGDVSAVFVNRLRQGMKLQTDPTIIYGLFDRYDGKIYRSNINEKTAYNTYQIDGLPPTPIALPSAEAIAATMHPSDVPYIYFVATGNGGHKFSVTLEEHNRAVAEYRRVMANQ